MCKYSFNNFVLRNLQINTQIYNIFHHIIYNVYIYIIRNHIMRCNYWKHKKISDIEKNRITAENYNNFSFTKKSYLLKKKKKK